MKWKNILKNTIPEEKENFKEKPENKYKYQQNSFTNLIIYPITSLGISSFHIMLPPNSEYCTLLPKLVVAKSK